MFKFIIDSEKNLRTLHLFDFGKLNLLVTYYIHTLFIPEADYIYK